MQLSRNNRRLAASDLRDIDSSDGEARRTRPSDARDVDHVDEIRGKSSISVDLDPDDFLALKRILSSLADVDREEAADEDSARYVARLMFDMRRVRSELFPASMFNEPAWDMLIALYIAPRAPALTDLARATDTPLSTAVRWLEYLENHSLVVREGCPTDRRSYSISLTDNARASLRALFSKVVSKLPSATEP